MAKKRYSEEFYNEIDALIKVQQELTTKRFVALEFTRMEEKSGKKAGPGYEPPPSFWAVVKKNRLMLYLVIFVAATVLTLVFSTVAAHRADLRGAADGKETQVASNEKKVSMGARKTMNLSAMRDKLEVKIQPVSKKWPGPKSEKLKTYKSDKEVLEQMPDKDYEPVVKFRGKPEFDGNG